MILRPGLRAIRIDDGSIAALARRESSLRQHDDDDSQDIKRMRCSWSDLPEEIWHHIYTLVPMREAARAACVSHTFLRSWRCHTNLTLTKETIFSKETIRKGFLRIDVTQFDNNIDHIMANHSTDGVKKFMLELDGPYSAKHYGRLDSWLKIAVTPMTEELSLILLWSGEIKYNFPCSFLSDGRGNTIRYLNLRNCTLRPTFELGLRSLTMLHLCGVCITGDDLGYLFSNSFALEQLELTYCDDIFRLEIPCLLQRFSHLEVFECRNLQVIESKAPNLSSFCFTGNQIQLSFGESLKIKSMKLYYNWTISYAIDKLTSLVPNLETLTMHTVSEMVNVPMVSGKFLHLKFLTVTSVWDFRQEYYDYLSLVSFFDASPSLETFILHVENLTVYEWIEEEDLLSMRRMPEHHHGNLKSVRITGFSREKSMVELTLHILENTTSLECLTLDTIPDYYRRCGNIPDKECLPFYSTDIMKVHDTILAIRTYIEEKVPSTVKLNVLEPCSRCHAL
ncbi:hypothetical protein ACQ4PT_042491 [Festuca glaucescens]